MNRDEEPFPTETTDPGGTALTIEKFDGFEDWYFISRAGHDGRDWMGPSPLNPNVMITMCSRRLRLHADVEGRREEMLDLARAIERRGSESYKRCAVRVCGEMVEFWSPRNSNQLRGVVTLADADKLAREIRTLFGEPQ